MTSSPTEVARGVAACVHRLLRTMPRDAGEKAWQLALDRDLGSQRQREVRLEQLLGYEGWLRVFGRGRAVDFVVAGVPVELKILKRGRASGWDLMSLLQQGLIWRAAAGTCVVVALSMGDLLIDQHEIAFLDWLAERDVHTVIASAQRMFVSSTSRAGRWTARSAPDVARTALAADLEAVVRSLGPAPSLRHVRTEVATCLLHRGWKGDAIPPGRRTLFGVPSARQAGVVVDQDGTRICVQTVIVRARDAGAADGNFQIGIAASPVVEGLRDVNYIHPSTTTTFPHRPLLIARCS